MNENGGKVKINGLKIDYNDYHDLAAIIETNILDVYGFKNIQKGDIVIDIGAGIGEFTILASKRIGATGRIISVEPSPEDYSILLQNIKNNDCKNVTALNIAISDKQGSLHLNFKGKEFTATADSLSNILQSQNIPIDEVKFLKMDIEGGSAW